MAKRLTPFIGLAVVAALALAAAFGAFSLNPAQAAVDAPNARGLAQPVDFQSQTTPTPLAAPATAIETVGTTTTARTDIVALPTTQVGNMRMAVGDSITIDLKDSIDNTSAAMNDPRDGTTTELNAWKLLVTDGMGVVTLDPANNAAVQALADTGDLGVATSTEVKITAAQPGVATLRLDAYDFQTTVVAATDRVTSSNRTFSIVVVGADLTLDDSDPGENTRYDVTFVATANLQAGVGEVTIELEDFDFPGSTVPGAVGISSDAYYATEDDDRQPAPTNAVAGWNEDGSLIAPASSYQGGLITPEDVSISGEKITISVPDMNPENDRGDDINAGDFVRVVIRQGAGIANPSEGGNYPAVITDNNRGVEQTSDEENVPRLVTLDETDGGRGTVVTATGKGFKNGLSLGFFLDKNANGMPDSGEVRLCDVARVGGDDTGSCSFTVSNPPFTPGNTNVVGAVDGRGQTANKAADNMHDDQRFDLTPSIAATPKSGNPGETILVQGYDFPTPTTAAGARITVNLSRVELARQGGARDIKTSQSITATVGTNGDLDFQFTIPNWAPEGVQELRVFVSYTAEGADAATTADDNTTITVGGPVVTSTPKTVLANQRVSLVGTGFSPDAEITGADADDNENWGITVGGVAIEDQYINEGGTVTVDNGGKWSASVILPLSSVTTRDGEREIRVTDSDGRSGTVKVTIPAREVTIDPPAGRLGTTAIIRGKNFPSKNDLGASFNIQIEYDPGSGRPATTSVTADASGSFEAEITVPSSATIPSTNVVRVTFDDADNVPVTTTVSHEVPEGTITLSETQGVPGSTITLRGEGFKTFVPVRSVKVGSIDVIPSPAPSTNAQGMIEFDILIPGLESGIQTIEVEISDTTASIGFTVQSAAEVGAETRVADGIANLGDNFVRAFNFNNDTKTWTFYDPDAADASTMEYFIAGSSYWVLVGASQEVILNRKTRNLSCANDSCWNLIVW